MILLVRERPTERPAATARGRARELPADFWKFLVAAGLFGLGNATNALIILRAQNIGLSLETTILAHAGFNLCASLVSFPSGYVSDRFGRKRTLIAAIVIFVITYAGLAAGKSPFLVAILFVLFASSRGCTGRSARRSPQT